MQYPIPINSPLLSSVKMPKQHNHHFSFRSTRGNGKIHASSNHRSSVLPSSYTSQPHLKMSPMYCCADLSGLLPRFALQSMHNAVLFGVKSSVYKTRFVSTKDHSRRWYAGDYMRPYLLQVHTVYRDCVGIYMKNILKVDRHLRKFCPSYWQCTHWYTETGIPAPGSFFFSYVTNAATKLDHSSTRLKRHGIKLMQPASELTVNLYLNVQ